MKPPVENRTLTGTADAKGETGSVQGKKRVFHWRMLLFHLGAEPVFPLKLREEAPSTSRQHTGFSLEKRCLRQLREARARLAARLAPTLARPVRACDSAAAPPQGAPSCKCVCSHCSSRCTRGS